MKLETLEITPTTHKNKSTLMSAPSSDSEDGGSQQQDLLALLEAQCAGAMGIEPVSRAPPAASSSKRTLDEASSDEDDGADSDGQWSGISEEDAAHEGQQTESEAAVIEFAEPSRRATGQGSKQDYKQFMVCFELCLQRSEVIQPTPCDPH